MPCSTSARGSTSRISKGSQLPAFGLPAARASLSPTLWWRWRPVCGPGRWRQFRHHARRAGLVLALISSSM